MKKILSYILIVLGLAVLITGTSEKLFYKIADSKSYEHNTSFWGEHYCPGGDLVNMAYLDDIAKFQAPKDYKFIRPVDSTGTKNIDLYLWGDSYVEDIPNFAFGHINAYHFGRNYYKQLHYTLDHSKKNILIIESAERFTRAYLTNKSIYKEVSKINNEAAIKQRTNVPTSIGSYDIGCAFNTNINQNIEFILFNYNFLNKPRLLKADINYMLFNRASGDVTISDDGAHLFLKKTVLPVHWYSSYEPIRDSAIKWYVQEVNSIYDHYKAEGFDEVYLSIIPNPATIVQPAKYNNFIPRLCQNPDLRMPVINVYPAFKNDTNPNKLYRAGDTHWSNNGIQIWLGMVNERLNDVSTK